ncbi:uracil-DNA glycosylase [archaeon]|jgi:uracil-DNA glycosylase|nr:uracil-DNA glycosylase [archaeon]MBT6698757.1 uracil-DNA glycosylase [archaeon]
MLDHQHTTNQKIHFLKQKYTSCQSCKELCESRSQVVFGSGNLNAEILFIGEAPGANEDKNGIPFCGASGQILQDLLQSINYDRNQIFITNTVLCKPPKNRNPKANEIKACNERLNQTIQAINPKIIVTIGNFATKAITKTKVGITKIRGKPIETTINNSSYTIVPVVHPANLLYNGRNPVIFQQMKDDFNIIKKIINKKTKHQK